MDEATDDRPLADDNQRRIASVPFNKPSADVILRTSDRVDFFVRRAILGESSSVFEDMFSLACSSAATPCDPGTEIVDGLPVITIAEDSTTLDSFLRFAYPVRDPEIESRLAICRVLEIARKYLADDIEPRLIERFAALAESHPLQRYALATERRWNGETKVAAWASLRYPFPVGGFVDEMENISAGDYVRLQKYHMDCCESLKAALRIEDPPPARHLPAPSQIEAGVESLKSSGVDIACPHLFFPLMGSTGLPSHSDDVTFPFFDLSWGLDYWWSSYLDKVVAPLFNSPRKALNVSPSLDTLPKCDECSGCLLEHLGKFNKELEAYIDNALSKVGVYI